MTLTSKPPELPSADRGFADPYLSSWSTSAVQGRWPLRGPVVTIGRSPSSDIVIDDLRVSRLHVTLERVAGVWTVVDDGLSRNGTFVNGRRLSGRLQLHDRDTIRVGETALTYCAPGRETGPHTLVSAPLPTATSLTPAQRAVLIALCRPYKHGQDGATPATNRHIADELCVSLDAVKAQLRSLFHKLGIDELPQNEKRARLVAMALRFGLVSQHDL